jgi:hypothetical protein
VRVAPPSVLGLAHGHFSSLGLRVQEFRVQSSLFGVAGIDLGLKGVGLEDQGLGVGGAIVDSGMT